MKKSLFILLIISGALLAQRKITLQECVDIALENNNKIQISNLEQKSAQAGKLRSYQGILPSISSSFNAQYSKQGPSEFQFHGITQQQPASSSEYYNAGLRYNQTLYNGGRWWNRITLGKKRYQNARISKKQTQQKVRSRVIQVFYRLLKAQKLLEVYQESYQSSKRQLQKTREMYKLEEVARKDYLKAKVQAGNDSLQIIKQKNSIVGLKQDFENILGKEISSDYILKENKYKKPEKIKIKKALNKAYQNNLELAVLEMQQKVADLNYMIEKGGLYPKLTTSMSYSRSGSEMERVYSKFDKFWDASIGLNLSFSLFEGFSRKVSIQQSKIELNKYKERIQQKKLEIKNQLTRLLKELKMNRKMIELNRMNLSSAKADLESAQNMYELGSASILEVLDARVNLTKARNELISNKYDAKISEAKLKHQMGTL